MAQNRSKAYLKKLFRDFIHKYESLGWHQIDAAKELGITRSHLNKVINNRTDPSLSLIEDIENFTYGDRKSMTKDLDNIIIDTSHVSKELSEFTKYYWDEISSAMKNLQEEQSFKIFMLFFLNFHTEPSSEDIFDSISIEEIQQKMNCSAEEVSIALDELIDKGYLLYEQDEEGYVKSFTFVEKPGR